MTDNEIIKALECCPKEDCVNCPEFKFGGCISIAMEEALALINRQKGEIEKREKGLQFLQETIGKNESRWLDIVSEQRAEAIKEFAKRLKEKYPWKGDYLYSTRRTVENIDNLVKEMVGADNG